MPRVAITISLMDDENRPLNQQSWSPLGYEDLGNPNLTTIEATLLNGAERNLLERLRNSIDRALLSFARRERRRWAPMEARPNVVEAQIIDDYTGEYVNDPEFEHIGDIARSSRMVRMDPNPVINLTEAQRLALITEQPVAEDQREPPKKTKRARPVKRVSRYKRDPVI